VNALFRRSDECFPSAWTANSLRSG
jgi:hypothetical protein